VKITRVTKKLLNRYEISKPTASYHQHSKLNKNKYILEELKKARIWPWFQMLGPQPLVIQELN